MSNEAKDPATGVDDELTYEQAYEQLEQILSTLESGELALEESLALYERGAALATHCIRKLDEAQLRVEQWRPNGETVPLDDWEES